MEESFVTASSTDQSPFTQALLNESKPDAYTWNGAKSYASASDIKRGGELVAWMFKALRSAEVDYLKQLWVSAKHEDNLAAKLLAFFTRDRFRGKGEKKPFDVMLRHEVEDAANLSEVQLWYPLIAYFGYPKDLLKLAGTNAEATMLRFYCEVVLEDKRRLEAGKPITTFGKYAPTEGGADDKKHKLVGKMCKIYGELQGVQFTKKDYRKMHTTIRAATAVTERLMCLNLWEQIKFSGVPSRCMLNNRKAFEKHTPELWKEYLSKLEKGDEKINAKLFPHDIGSRIMRGEAQSAELQAMWDTMIAACEKEFALCDMSGGVLVIPDTSGSMGSAINGAAGGKVTCKHASVSLAVFFAQMLKGPFKNKILPFSTECRFVEIKGKTLKERFNSIPSEIYDQSTNFLGTGELMLSTAHKYKIPREQMPRMWLAISDMQFNAASGSSYWGNAAKAQPTNLEALRDMFAKSMAPDGRPYDMPVVVYWNVNGQPRDFPAQAGMNDIAMLSGFSPSVLRLVFGGEIDPVQVVKRAISDPRYEPIARTITEKRPVDWKKFLYADFEKEDSNKEKPSSNNSNNDVKTVEL